MSEMIFVTATALICGKENIRQGWVKHDLSRRMVGESGHAYDVIGKHSIVANPPEAPSEKAQRVIDEME